MNNNTNIVVLGGIIAVVILGGIALVVYGPSSGSQTATSTPATTNSTTPKSGSPSTHTGTPTVTTGVLVGVSGSLAAVTGKVVPNGAQTTYWYEYGTTNTLGSRTAPQAIGGGFNAIAAPTIINGLSANTLYYYRLNAQNSYGTIAGQSNSFTTNNAPPLQGIAPTTRTSAASAVLRTSASLNGQVNPNNTESAYWFEYGENADFGNTTALQSAGNGDITRPVSVSLANLKPLTRYFFRVNAQNQFGTVTGATMNFITIGPVVAGVPTVVTTSAGTVATSSATMRGHLNPNNYPTTYWFEYGTDLLLSGAVLSSARTEIAGSATVTVTVSAETRDLTPNTKYYYQLVATNSYGTVRGDVISFTTKKR